MTTPEILAEWKRVCAAEDTGNTPTARLAKRMERGERALEFMPRLIEALEHALKGLDEAGRIDVHDILTGGPDESR